MKGAKVLYVEDEVFLGKIVRESLESRGYDIIMETDGERALLVYEKVIPDICVLDVMLPGMNGFDMAKQIRLRDKTTPILFLTAKSQTEDVVQGFKTGGNDYIRKPFSMEELIVRIENLLQRNVTTVQQSVGIGSFKFDFARQLLVNGSNEIRLSYREAALLKALYENRETIINRNELLNLLWGNDNFFNSRNLDVYITRLRTHLKPDSAVEIVTVKGIGYRFIC